MFWAPLARSSDAESLTRESVLLLSEGNVSGAKAQAEAASAADPRSVAALSQLAKADNAAMDFSAAEQAAGRALELAGPAPELLCLRSEARAGRGNFAGALEDAQAAVARAPRSASASLRRAAALEGLGRRAASWKEYQRAAALDAGLFSIRDAAKARLAPGPFLRRAVRGRILLLLAAGCLLAAVWRRRRGVPVPARGLGPLGGRGRVEPREALRLLAQAAPAASDPDGALMLAEALYERLTGRRPYPFRETVSSRVQGLHTPPSLAAENLPPGLDEFFARALNPDPARRFLNGAELERALRGLVEPPVD